MRHFSAYIFDVDGTLLESADDICGAILDVLAPTGCRITRPELTRFVGVHLLDMYREVVPGYTDEKYWEMIEQYRAVYAARKHGSTRIYPGVREALGALQGRTATATTKATPTTRAILDQFELLPLFDHVQGTDGFPYKPAPDVIFASLNGLSVKPEECLFGGDSPADMEAGRRAGVAICGVRYGYGNAALMEQWKPDYWVDDLRELL